MTITRTILATIAMCLAAAPAGAVLVDLGASTLNGNTVIDYSSAGALSFDVRFNNGAAVIVAVTLESSDGGTLSWDGFVDNLTGANWTRFDIALLDGAGLQSVGDVTGDFSSATVIGSDNEFAELSFDAPGEPSGFELGALDGGLGSSDWLLDVGSLAANDTFYVSLQPRVIPLPAPLWLLAGALVLLARPRAPRTAGLQSMYGPQPGNDHA